MLQVEGDRSLPTTEHTGHRIGDRGPARPIDPDDVRSETGQHHAGERCRPKAGKLDHGHVTERHVVEARWARRSAVAEGLLEADVGVRSEASVCVDAAVFLKRLDALDGS